MSAQSADWLFPVPVTFGAGRIADLPELIKGKNCSRPLVICDKGGDRAGITKRAQALAPKPVDHAIPVWSFPLAHHTAWIAVLSDGGLKPTLYDKVEPNPTDVCVCNGAALFRVHACDSIVAIGGGSGLDAGKSTAMVAGSGLALDDFEWTKTPPALAPGALPPVWLVPTTAGTGAEMDSASMVTDTSKAIKICVAHPTLRTHVVADPQLTLTLPATLTAWTGMDALPHAIEALSVDMYHPMCVTTTLWLWLRSHRLCLRPHLPPPSSTSNYPSCRTCRCDGIALEALRIIHKWLPIAFANGRDLEARSQMLAAASMAAVAFQKGLGATHGLSEPIGAVHNTQHGLTNGSSPLTQTLGPRMPLPYWACPSLPSLAIWACPIALSPRPPLTRPAQPSSCRSYSVPTGQR